jgi:threonine dehydrogenase-like Zn-dependent dehydrogenase
MLGLKRSDMAIVGLGTVGLIATSVFSFRILRKLDSR